MMLTKKTLILALGIAITGLSGAAIAQTTAATDQAVSQKQAESAKVIYHINDSDGQALGALRNMRNHLDTAPNTKIVAIAHADGIEFLRTDYKDADQVGPLVSGLASRGVKFEVCEITIARKKYSKDDFVMEADFTPSGVVRITELQNKEGYAYLKP